MSGCGCKPIIINPGNASGGDVVPCEEGNAQLVRICGAGSPGESPFEPEPRCAATFEVCRCDDPGGGSPGEVTEYVELYCVDADGVADLLYTYQPDDPATPYTPVNPVPCPVDPGPEPEPQRQIVESCRCDDVNGDGSNIVGYVEVWSFDPNTPGAAPLLLGRFENGDYASPYTPVNPLPECPDE